MAKPDVKALKQARDKGLAWARSGASADGVSPLQLESSRTARKRCKGVTKSGEPCTAWAREGGLCYFHANPNKAAELGRNGGRRRKHTYEQATEQIAPPESAADVRRMLAETMADVKAGRMDPKVANTVAYVGTVLLRAYEADAAATAAKPVQSCVPLIRLVRLLAGSDLPVCGPGYCQLTSHGSCSHPNVMLNTAFLTPQCQAPSAFHQSAIEIPGGNMKKLLAELLCFAVSLSVFASNNGYKVTYDGRSLTDMKPGTGLHLFIDQDKVRFVNEGKEVASNSRRRYCQAM